MKLQSLAVIFIIIIMPITMVLSEYINNKIKTQETELLYDTRLLNCTFDAIKAYQLNTINNEFGDVTNKKIEDIQAAAKTFFNSLSSSFNYTGYNSEVMKEYVPAVVFTMYDGYYTYSPFLNVLTNVEKGGEGVTGGYDDKYSNDGEKLEGLKPYVYYSCRYKIGDNTDFTIVYTLDNYITIQGEIDGEYVYDYGYLYSINTDNGIRKSGESYIYDGVEFTKDDTEELKEYVGKDEYSYAKINGKKYYLDVNAYPDREGTVEIDGENVSKKTGIFYISSTTGERNYSQTKGYLGDSTEEANDKNFIKYYKAIKHNKSAYEYYKNAYEFSSAVLGITERYDKANTKHSNGYNLKDKLQSKNADIYNDASSDTTSLKSWGNMKIFDDSNIAIQNAGSNFNQHRKAVIRNVIETNLTTAIASFSSGATNVEFIMPKISEEDWETIENDVCAISFMQGMSIGSKKYNGYSVVANTLTKEYVDENDIYILAQDTDTNGNIYCTVNDGTIEKSSKIKTKGTGTEDLTYYPGIWKINFESKQYIDNHGKNNIYVPIKDYAGSYTSIMGSYAVKPIGEDMYTYVHGTGNSTLKNAYYKALGRERWGAYNVNNINYEIYNGNGEEYFLNSY